MERFGWYNAIYLLTTILQLAAGDNTRTDRGYWDADARMRDLHCFHFIDLGRAGQLIYPVQAIALFDLIAREVPKSDFDVLEKIKDVVRQLQSFSKRAERYTVEELEGRQWLNS